MIILVSIISSKLECKCCSSIFPIPRRKSGKREKGHIKHLWCIKCKERTEHIEQSYYW